MITATSSPYTQQLFNARVDTQTGNNQGTEIQRYNIQISEHNRDFLYSPQVRSAGFSDQPRPQAGPERPPVGRGGLVDVSA